MDICLNGEYIVSQCFLKKTLSVVNLYGVSIFLIFVGVLKERLQVNGMWGYHGI
jgi:hypothetical protein